MPADPDDLVQGYSEMTGGNHPPASTGFANDELSECGGDFGQGELRFPGIFILRG